MMRPRLNSVFSFLPWVRASLAAVVVITSSGCDEEEPAAPPPPTVVPGIVGAGAATAKHGGTVTRVGSHPVEVVTHASGQVYAYVESDVAAPASAEMDVEVPVAAGRRSVDLRWNASQRRYEGRVRNEAILQGPVTVIYVVDGVRLVSIVPIIVIAPAIRVRDVIVVDDHHHGKHKHKHRHWH